MKIINKTFSFIAILFFITIVQQINCVSQVERAFLMSRYVATPEQTSALIKAAKDTKEIIDNAALPTIFAQSDFLARKITAQEYDRIVLEKSAVIAQAEEKLKNLIDAVIISRDGKVEIQQGEVLSRQKQIIKDDYELALLDDELTIKDKALLQERYQTVIKQIDAEMILFGGNAYSWKQIAMGVFAATGILAGLTLINNWLQSNVSQ
jgi:hypothetical protein